jgi:hypothetical protein
MNTWCGVGRRGLIGLYKLQRAKFKEQSMNRLWRWLREMKAQSKKHKEQRTKLESPPAMAS